MNPYVRTLNHLAYILECLILDYTGEAKTELSQLACLLESDPGYSIGNSAGIAKELRQAEEKYRAFQGGHGASICSSVSRRTWEMYMDSFQKGETAQ